MVNVTVSTNGITGPRGNGWLSGAGIPSASVGFDGDFYLDTTNTGYYYGPKTAGAWGPAKPFGTGGGTAGGDLSGSYPNPTVAKVNGTAVNATPTAGQYLKATSGVASTWVSPGLSSNIQAVAATAAAGSTGLPADAGHVHTYESWLFSDNGLLWGSYPPIAAGTTTSPPVGTVPGKLTLQRMTLRSATTLNSVLFGLAGVDATGPISNSFIGVYDSTGTLRAATNDISATLMSTPTVKTIAFAATGSYSAAAGEYFIALLLNGTWTSAFTLKASGGGSTTNANLAAPHLALSNILTGQTSLPGSITLANQATNLITGGWGSQWYGMI